MSVTVPGVSAPGYSAIAGAVTGVVLWVLSTYAFSGRAVPAPIEGAAWVPIPAAVSGLAALVTRRSTTSTTSAPSPAESSHR